MPGPVRIFVSYAHEDDAFRERMEQILRPLEREFSLECFSDESLEGGVPWSDELLVHLREADFILMLVSDAFLASDYIHSVEMKTALEEHARGSGRIIPIIIRPCDWSAAPFARLQALPHRGRAITSWPNEDEAWADVSRRLREALRAAGADAAPRATGAPGEPAPTLSPDVAVQFLKTQLGSQRTTMAWLSAVIALLLVVGLATTAAAAVGRALLVPHETRGVQLLGGLLVAASSLVLVAAQARRRDRVAGLQMLIAQAARDQQASGQLSAQTLGYVQRMLAHSLGTLERTGP